MASIYRKYRPQSFSEMVGQNHIKLTLQNELETDSVVHAYMFCGPRGLGKTTAARLFSKSVNCEDLKSDGSEPCNKCNSCTEIMQAKSMDLIEIDAASHTGVDNVRENIVENVRFSPHKSKFKVFIIDEVHMLSISAFNALLKTLEEPPAHAIFILCTTEIHKVPDTIISRCQRFDFKKVGASECIKRLKKIATSEKVKIDDEVYDIIAAKSDGCIRDADGLLGQVLSLGGDRITKDQVALVLPTAEIGLVVEFIDKLVRGDISGGLDFINKLVEDGVDLEVFNKELIVFLRKLILIKSNVVKGEWFGLAEKIQKDAEKILEMASLEKIVKIIKVFMATQVELKNSDIAQLPLELALIKVSEGESRMESVAARVSAIKPLIKNPVKKDETSEEVGKKTNSSIDLDKIRSNWSKIIVESHTKNRDLLFLDETTVFAYEVSDDKLVVGFRFDILKMRFEKNGNKDIFASVIKDVTGRDIVLKAKTLKPSEVSVMDMAREAKENESMEMSGTKVSEDNILDTVLGSFGGEVIEDQE